MVLSLPSPWNQDLLKLLRKEEMLLRFHGGMEKLFWGIWISCLAPAVLVPALSPGFLAQILCFLQLLYKRTEMLFSVFSRDKSFWWNLPKQWHIPMKRFSFKPLICNSLKIHDQFLSETLLFHENGLCLSDAFREAESEAQDQSQETRDLLQHDCSHWERRNEGTL